MQSFSATALPSRIKPHDKLNSGPLACLHLNSHFKLYYMIQVKHKMNTVSIFPTVPANNRPNGPRGNDKDNFGVRCLAWVLYEIGCWVLITSLNSCKFVGYLVKESLLKDGTKLRVLEWLQRCRRTLGMRGRPHQSAANPPVIIILSFASSSRHHYCQTLQTFSPCSSYWVQGCGWTDQSVGWEQSLLKYISTALLLFQALRHNHSWERRVSDFVAQYPLFMPAGLRFKRFLIKGSLINNRSCFPAVYVYPVYVWRENSKTEKSRKG